MHRLWPLIFLIACGGSEGGFTTLEPAISVAPMALDFGPIVEQQTSQQVVFISNEGRATLEVTGISLTGDGAAAYAIDQTPFEIEANDEAPVTLGLSFTPSAEGDYPAQVVFESNDKESPSITVEVMGQGIPTPVPDICVDQTSLEWLNVDPGSSQLQILTIENCGNADLELGPTDQSGAGAFRVDLASDPSGATIAPGETQPVLVFYEPSHSLGDGGSLTITTLNDPDEPEVVVDFLGNGGPSTVQYPVAVIDCPGGILPPEYVMLDGSGSYDPNALEPLTYTWAMVVSPSGSGATLSSTTDPTTDFFADVGGDYEVLLSVENTDGVLSAPERCALSSVPPDDLHIELTWTQPNPIDIDMDLHLLQDDQTELFSVPGDCTWCNGNPSWGGSASADPELVLDSRALGPEIIAIESPAAGTYPVVVHYYDPFGGPSSEATVRVFAYGVEIFSDTQTLERNDVWEVGQVNWPAGTFGVYPISLFPALNRQCF